jgi:hypothetical protein
VSEDKTAETLHLPSFEERVLDQLGAVSSRLASLEKRVGEIDMETKPNWERLHRDFSDLHTDVKTIFGNFDRKLDVINSEVLQLKADQKGLERRVVRIESEPRPQIIFQDQ